MEWKMDMEEKVTTSEPINRWKILHPCDIKDYTLIIPSVAIGNVGQLSCDLVISTLKMKRIALIYSPAVIPMSGYDPYDFGSKKIASYCELYQCEEKKILILMIRAPLVYKYSDKFLTELVQKFKADNIRDIIILTSSFAHEKKHIMTSPFRYVVNNWCPYVDLLKSLEWVPHESEAPVLKIHGGGYSSVLYEIIKKEEIPCLVIYKFTSEGDNIPDAYEMTHYLNAIVKLFDETDFYSKLIHPVSWNLLFGNPPPRNIY